MKRSIISLTFITGLLVTSLACDSSLIPAGSSLVSKNNAQVAQVNVAPPNARTAYHAQALQIGNDMLADVKVTLSDNPKLTADQIDFVIENAKGKLEENVNKLVITAATLNLADEVSTDTTVDPNLITGDESPLLFVAPAIVGGTMESLASDKFPVTNPEDRSALAQDFVASSFQALNGQTTDLSGDDFSTMAGSMMGSAMETFNSIGLSSENVAAGTKAITQGAMGALQKAGVASENMSSISRAVVTGVIVNLKHVTISSDQLSQAVSSTTSGAVGAIQNLGLSAGDGSALVGSIAGDTVSNMSSLKVDSTVLLSTMQSVSKNIVSSLSNAGFANAENFASTVKLMTGAMVSSFDVSKFDKSVVSAGASFIMSGTISGIGSSGVSQELIASSGVVKEAMSGAVGSLGKTGMQVTDITQSMSSIMTSAVASLGSISSASSGDNFNNFLNDMMSGSMSSLQTAGVTDVSALASAVKNITNGVVTGLPQAGVNKDRFADISYKIAKDSVALVSTMNVSNTDDLKSITGGATAGMSESFGNLSKSGVMDEDFLKQTTLKSLSGAMDGLTTFSQKGTISTTDLSGFSTQFTTSAYQGLAYGSIQSGFLENLQSDLQSTLVDKLTSYGVSSSDIATFQDNANTQLNNAVSLSNTLASGVISCNEFSDSLTIEEFLAKASTPPVICAPVSGVCPMMRTFVKDSLTKQIVWLIQPVGNTFVCSQDRFTLGTAPGGTGGGTIGTNTGGTSGSGTGSNFPSGTCTPITYNNAGQAIVLPGTPGIDFPYYCTNNPPPPCSPIYDPYGYPITYQGTAGVDFPPYCTGSGTGTSTSTSTGTSTNTGSTVSLQVYGPYNYLVRHGGQVDIVTFGSLAVVTPTYNSAQGTVSERIPANTTSNPLYFDCIQQFGNCRVFTYSNIQPVFQSLQFSVLNSYPQYISIDVRKQGELDPTLGQYLSNNGSQPGVVNQPPPTSPYGSLNDLLIDPITGGLIAAGFVSYATGLPTKKGLFSNIDANAYVSNHIAYDLGAGFEDISLKPVAIARSVSGQIYIAGDYIYNNATFPHDSIKSSVFVARFTSAGVIDSSFGTGGMMVKDLSSASAAGVYDTLAGLLIYRDLGVDKIIIAGTKNITGTPNMVLRKYSLDGTPDTFFNSGVEAVMGTDYNSHASSLAVAGSMIIIGGKNGSGHFKVKRFDASAGNMISSSPETMPGDAMALYVYPDNSYIAVGSNDSSNNTNWYVTRYNSTGAVDTSFANVGVYQNNFGSFTFSQALSVDVQTDGKILISGFKAFSSTDMKTAVLLRLNSNGTEDTAFGGQGEAMFGEPNTIFKKVKIQPATGQNPERILILGAKIFGSPEDQTPFLAGFVP